MRDYQLESIEVKYRQQSCIAAELRCKKRIFISLVVEWGKLRLPNSPVVLLPQEEASAFPPPRAQTWR
jgi:hypothetical protein